jgi:hypothetical protein
MSLQRSRRIGSLLTHRHGTDSVGLILDSSVVIGAERHGENVAQLLDQVSFVAGEQRVALSSVGLTELVHAVYRSKTPSDQSRH